VARARCDELAAYREPPSPPAGKVEQDLYEPTPFGMRLGASTESIVFGARKGDEAARKGDSGKGPRAVVYDMLIDAESPEKHNRAAIFDPRTRAAGCGWQPHPTRGVCCAVLYAGAWEDSIQIVRRRKLPLELSRHYLSAHPEIPRYTIGFLGSTGVEAIQPRNHPVPCDGVAMLRLKVPTDVQLSAAFAPHLAPPVSSPLVFIQHAATRGEQEVLVRGPTPGIQTVAIHARRGNAAKFEYIGPIQFECTAPSLNERHLGFPETSAAFMRRCIRIREPLYSPLTSSELQDFEIVTPAIQFNSRAVAVLRHKEAGLEGEFEVLEQQLRDILSRKAAVAEAVAVRLQELKEEKARLNAALIETSQSGRPRSAGRSRKKDEQQEAAEEYKRRLAEIVDAEKEQKAVLASQGNEERRIEEQRRGLRSKLRVVRGELEQLQNEQKGSGTVELVCGSARHLLTTEGERRSVRGVTLQGPRASLLVDGECVAVWRITAAT